MNTVSVNLTDTKYFKFHTQTLGLNKDKLRNISVLSDESVPVYTAAKEAVAYIEELPFCFPLFASKAKPLLSFATNGDGSAGKNFVLHITPFYINRDRLAISCLSPDILLEFVWYQIKDIKSTYNFNHHFKANQRNLSSVQVEIP